MFFLRWVPTFLGFPLAGLLAVHTVGSVEGPGTAALAGLLAGAVVGLAQWLAVRRFAIAPRWVVHTAVAWAVGAAVAAVVTDAGTSVRALVLNGFITGAAVGASQGVVLRRGPRVNALWAVVVSVSWGLGWLVTGNVIVDADRGFITFGSSGALLATVLTGLALHRILGTGANGGRDVTEATADVGAAETRP